MRIEEAERAARREVDEVWAELPEEIRRALRDVLVMVRVSQNDREKDLLGLFSGLVHADGPPLEPDHVPQITLFVDSILDYTDGQPEEFLQECRTTLLHEIGHYLGWDEEEVEQRGL